jgi:hypothetical protein
MIITKLEGGLGNQMFQYAAGLALAERHGTALKLDLSFFSKEVNGITPRQYGLQVFRLTAEFASEADKASFGKEPASRLKRVAQRFFPFLFSKVTAVESGYGFHSQFLNFPANTFLKGYWQSEKYFKDYSEKIRAAFQPLHDCPAAVTQLKVAMASVTSVSLHVRRGDFISLPGAAVFHGALELDYYKKAVTEMKKRHGQFRTYIFSDDADYCKTQFDFIEDKYVVDLKSEAVWDLELMKHCHHHIIANSSFSWWGAWLNPNTNKTVIMPKNWYRHLSAEEAGIKPETWICL